jgi:hypothetical protein
MNIKDGKKRSVKELTEISSPAINAPFFGFPLASISPNTEGRRPSFAKVMITRVMRTIPRLRFCSPNIEILLT